MPPLISVMMPSYNASKTLPLALSSLIAQTYSNWECILVDDGSEDRTCQLAEGINDERIRYFRFEQNKGRGAARQFALKMAQGDYLCMLDADDWIYPQKLQYQVQVMDAMPDISVLSMGMAIVNPQNDIVGVRSFSLEQNGLAVFPALREPRHPPFGFPPTMIRMAVAQNTEFDQRFRLSQDTDYLVKILLSHPFGILSEIAYAYSEIASVTLEKIVQSLRFGRLMYSKYRRQYPCAAYKGIADRYLKECLYRAGFAFGLGEHIIARRSNKPTNQNILDFVAARRIVDETAKKYFPNVSETIST